MSASHRHGFELIAAKVLQPLPPHSRELALRPDKMARPASRRVPARLLVYRQRLVPLRSNHSNPRRLVRRQSPGAYEDAGKQAASSGNPCPTWQCLHLRRQARSNSALYSRLPGWYRLANFHPRELTQPGTAHHFEPQDAPSSRYLPNS